MPRMVFVFTHTVVPYTTTTHRHKWVKGTKYQEYARFRGNVREAIQADMVANGWERSEGEPLRIAVIYNRGVTSVGLHKRDMTNILKGTEDGAQKAAYKNDAWVDQEVAMRANCERVGDLLMLVVQPKSDGPKLFSRWLGEIEIVALEHGFVL